MFRLLFLCNCVLISAEVITFIKDTSITCAITEECAYNGLYLTSPNYTINRKTQEFSDWLDDDWTLATSEEISFFPVTDIRWEDFSAKETKILISEKSTTSFSVCSPDTFSSMQASTHEFLSLVSPPNNQRQYCQWMHYFVQDKNIYSFHNETNYTSEWDLTEKPDYLTADDKKVRIKPHKYTFRMAREISDLEKYSQIAISESNLDNLCVSLFASLDNNSYLKLTLISDSGITSQIIEGFNLDEHQPKSWKRFEIKIDGKSQNGSLSIQRFRNDTGKTGFWAIDEVSLCRPEIDIFSTEISPATEISCKSLNRETSLHQDFCQKFAYFGRECQISHEFIFGNFDTESYKVCLENDECECILYQTAGCNQSGSCSGGFVKTNCTAWCKQIDKTEKCVICRDRRYFGEDCKEKLPVVMDPPTLEHIENNYFEINLKDLKYGSEEVPPDAYQVQYKAAKFLQFSNFSDVKPFSSPLENVKMNLTRTTSYLIRVLFYVNDVAFYENVPELLIRKHSLMVTKKKNNFYLEWDITELKDDRFYLEFQCSKSGVESCTFTLFIKKASNYILLDALTTDLTVEKYDKSISLSNNEIVVKFLKCGNVSNYISYEMNKTCVSAECLENVQNATLSFIDKENRNDFCTISISNVTFHQEINEFTITQPVTNLSVIFNSNGTITLQWQYNTTKEPSYHRINYTNGKSYEGNNTNIILYPNVSCTTQTTMKCGTNLTNLKEDTLHNISVQVKMSSFSEWSPPQNISVRTAKKSTINEIKSINKNKSPHQNNPPTLFMVLAALILSLVST